MNLKKIHKTCLCILGVMGMASIALASETAESLLSQTFPSLRLERSDLALRSDRWDTVLTLPAVETLFQNPVSLSATSSQWTMSLQKTQSSSDLLRLSASLLNIALTPPSRPSGRTLKRTEKDKAVGPLVNAIEHAHPLLQRALSAFSPSEQQTLIQAWQAPMLNENDSPDTKAVALAERFRPDPLLQAAFELTQAADAVIQQAGTDLVKGLPPQRIPLAAGDLWIVGPGNRTFTETDLKNVSCLIKTGGTSHYEGAVAAAGPGQIRMIIDFSDTVTVDAEAAPQAAGSGMFGIGLFYLPNPRGSKTIHSGDFSQGAGYFGVGGFFANASSATLTGHRFTQGAGSFGVGLFSNRAGSRSLYKARYAGQGAGFTRGVGLFLHHGDEATLEGGLFFADPREPQAITSFCQGVGYGPRAIAGGGIGLALVEGDQNQMNASYFAQGSGYWHSVGSLAVVGRRNRLQARRYDQGAGVHSAFGALHLEGDQNQTINWGVGPAYGWDYGIGLFTVQGNANQFYAEWASGHGDVNGDGMVVVQGDRNQLMLPGLGTGALTRNAPSYGAARVDGQNNVYAWAGLPKPFSLTTSSETPFSISPWGALLSSGRLTFDPTLKMPTPVWPAVPSREEKKQKEHKVLIAKMEKALQKPAAGRVADWVAIAGSFSLDEEAPRQAVEKLLALKDEELTAAVQQVSSESVDQFLQLKLVLSAYGPRATPSILSEMKKAQGTRKALLINLLASSRVDDAVEPLIAALQDGDWRVRRAAVGTLSALLNQESGRTAGRRTLLSIALQTCEKKSNLSFPSELTMPELFGVLSLNGALKEADRLHFFGLNPSAFNNADAKTQKGFVQLLLENRALYQTAITQEIDRMAAREDPVRNVLFKQLHDPDSEVVQATLIGLGQIRNAEDASRVAPFLENNSASLREAAATALGKMEEASLTVLVRALQSPQIAVRQMALVGAAQSPAASVQSLLLHGLDHADPKLRQTALSLVSQLYSPSKAVKRDVRKLLNQIKDKDPLPVLRLTAEIVLTGL